MLKRQLVVPLTVVQPRFSASAGIWTLDGTIQTRFGVQAVSDTIFPRSKRVTGLGIAQSGAPCAILLAAVRVVLRVARRAQRGRQASRRSGRRSSCSPSAILFRGCGSRDDPTTDGYEQWATYVHAVDCWRLDRVKVMHPFQRFSFSTCSNGGTPFVLVQ